MRTVSGLVFSAAAVLLAGTALIPCTPARAAVSFNVNFGFNYFHDRLGYQGRWLYSPIWGDVWQPRRRLVGYDFQPYTNGYWEYTDEYGWYWVSEDPFDDVVYHYGRWVYDPDMNWIWIPGYTWGPGWVVWREGGGYSGWMPMPPDEAFVSGTGLSLGMNFGSVGFNFYGYDRWYGNRVDPGRFWVVVDNRNLANRDYRRYVVPRERARVIINNTRNVTKFEVVNNRVVNRSIDVKIVERASGRRIAPVPAREVIRKDAVITTVDESRNIRERERAQHPIRAGFERGGAGGGMAGPNGGTAGAATGSKVGPGPGPGPGGATGRPGGAMNGPANEQPNGAAEGGKHERNSTTGGGGMNGPANEQPNGAVEGNRRERSNGGATTGGAEQPNGTPESGKRNRNEPGGNAATTGTPGAGGEAPAGNENTAHKPRSLSNGSSDENNNASSGSERTSHGSRNSTMTGPEGGQPNGASPNENNPGGTPKRDRHNSSGGMGSDNGPQNEASPNGPPPGEHPSRTPRNNPGAMTGPSDNSPPQEPRQRAGNPNGSNPGGPAPAASNPQQPDSSGGDQKKKKHNPPGTTPASGTPQ